MPPKKKPAKAKAKPKKVAKQPEKAKPQEEEPEMAEEEQEEEEEEEDQEDQVVKPAMAAVKQELLSPKKVPPKLAKAKASPKKKVSPKKKGEKPEKGLPAPNKSAWVDVRNQVNSLAKKGKPKLREQFNAAKEKGTQGKREFYYNVFLLDPDVAKKEIHKSSQQITSTKSSLAKGWMTVSQHAIMLGVDRQDPDFKQLAEAACEGLPIRDHENKALARLGVKQVYAEVRLLDEDTDERKSTTEACQRLQDEDMTAEQFQHVENALKVAPEAKQFMLGTKGAKSAKTDAAILDKEEEEPEKAEDGYKRYYGRLTGSLTSYGNQIDKTEIQLKSVKNAKLNAEHEEQREERIKSLEKALVAYKKTKSQWMEKIGSLATSLEEGLGEETAWAKVEDVKNLQKELDQEVTALRKNLLAQKQLWSQIPQSA